MTDNEGNTAWHVAAEGGHIKAVQCLLKEGAQLESTNHAGCTALHIAARSGQLIHHCDLLVLSLLPEVVFVPQSQVFSVPCHSCLMSLLPAAAGAVWCLPQLLLCYNSARAMCIVLLGIFFRLFLGCYLVGLAVYTLHSGAAAVTARPGKDLLRLLRLMSPSVYMQPESFPNKRAKALHDLNHKCPERCAITLKIVPESFESTLR